MSDMVERVAMALASDLEDGFPRFTQMRWDQLTVPARQAFLKRARVAIEAMREPTESMKAAGAEEDDECHADMAPTTAVHLIYRAMVSEALK